MTKKHATSGTELLAKATRQARRQKFVLRLYIAGMTPALAGSTPHGKRNLRGGVGGPV